MFGITKICDEIDKQVETDIAMTTGALGLRGHILSASETGGFDLAVKSDVLLMKLKSDEKDGLPSMTAEGSRVRLGLEGARAIELEQGGELRPSSELGVRYESGDAEMGTGLEVGGGLRYSSAGSGVMVEARGRGLVASDDDDDYEDWGLRGSIQVQPGARGQGLSLSLAPSWGAVSSGTGRLWSGSGVAHLAAGDEAALRGRLHAELGYGLGTLGGRGLLTPYAGVSLSSGGGRDWRMGCRYRFGPHLHLNLEGTRREGVEDDDAPDHHVILHGAVHW